MEAYNFILEERKKLLRAKRDGKSNLADSSQNGKSVVHREKRQGCTAVITNYRNQYNNSFSYTETVCNNATGLIFYCKFKRLIR
jgi:hypothetical protein